MKWKNLFSLLFVAAMFCQIGFAQPVQRNAKRSHFVYSTSIALLGGVGELKFENRHLPNNKNFVAGVQQLIAYQFNPYVTLGIGAGVDVWRRTAFIPLFGHITVNFLADTKIVPQWYANAGYAFKWYVTAQPEKMTKVVQANVPGVQAESGLGIKINIKEKLAITLHAHYKLQCSDIKYTVLELNEEDHSSITTNRSKNMLYHFVGLKVGLLYF